MDATGNADVTPAPSTTRFPTRRPSKVAWISCVGEVGGAEVYMLNLLRHLARDQFTPEVLLLRPGPLQEQLERLGVASRLFPVHRMRDLTSVIRTIRMIADVARQSGIDLIHSNGFRAHVYGGIAARLARIPEVWSVHTAERPGVSTSLISAIPSSHVLANCPRTLRFFVIRRHLTSLLWPSVDLAALKDRTSRAELAERYELPIDARWISMAARLQRYKGQDYFLRALASLPDSLGGVQGVLIGGSLFGMETGYPDELRELAESLHVERRAHFTGFIPEADVRGFMAESELVVHPALDEDFGLSVAEAQALGRPVLAFATVGPSAIVADGQTGYLVNVGNQAQLNLGLVRLLSQPEELKAMGERAAVRAAAKFSATRLVRQMERAYATALAQTVACPPQGPAGR